MIGIGKDDLRVQIPRQNSLDRGLRPHRHEHGSFNDTVRRMQQPSPRARYRAFGLNLEGKSVWVLVGQPLSVYTIQRDSSMQLVYPCQGLFDAFDAKAQLPPPLRFGHGSIPPPDLQARLALLAAQQGRDSETLAREAIERLLTEKHSPV